MNEKKEKEIRIDGGKTKFDAEKYGVVKLTAKEKKPDGKTKS